MELKRYVAAVRKRWLLVAAAALAGALIAFLYAKSATPMYRSTAKVFVSLVSAESTTELVQGSLYTQNLVDSYAELATMPAVLDPVIEELDLDVSARQLATTLSADAGVNTVILSVSAVETDPQLAADIANAVVRQLSVVVRDVSATRPNQTDTVKLSVVTPAVPPSFAFSPNTRMTTAFGLLLGLGSGVVVAVGLAQFDTRLRGRRDIAEVTDVPVLGSVPYDAAAARDIAMLQHPRSSAAEAYRRIQSNLHAHEAYTRAQSIAITSAKAGDGKTTTAINLAMAYAEKTVKVLLIDGELRKPSIAEHTGLDGAIGLTTVLTGRAALHHAVQKWANTGVEVLTAGEPPSPGQVVDPVRMRGLLDQAVRTYDVVLIDAPPMMRMSEAAVLTGLSQGVVAVVDCREGRRQEVSEALASIEAVGVPCLGIVANAVVKRRESRSGPGRPQPRAVRPAPTPESPGSPSPYTGSDKVRLPDRT